MNYLTTLTITLIGTIETTFTVADTNTAPQATYALADFKAGKQIHFADVTNKTVYVPFHAIDHIDMSKESNLSSATTDPYGCEVEILNPPILT